MRVSDIIQAVRMRENCYLNLTPCQFEWPVPASNSTLGTRPSHLFVVTTSKGVIQTTSMHQVSSIPNMWTEGICVGFYEIWAGLPDSIVNVLV
jgi:hypothetical protein